MGGYHQYMQRDNISTVGDNISTVEGIQYCGGIPSVLWGDSFSTVGDTFSTVEVVQYSGGITSVQWGDSFSTVEGIQNIGGITSVQWGIHQYCGGYSVQLGKNFNFGMFRSLIMTKRY